MPGKKKASSSKKRKLPQKKGEGTPAAKKPTPQKPAAAATLPTSKARLTLKEQLEKQKQEAQEWKKKALAYESGQKQLDKADELKLLKPAGEDDKVLLMLTNGLKQDVYNSFKFMYCDGDVAYVISECLKHTTDWPKIKKLDGPDLDELVDSYVEVYYSKICSAMNTARSADQT